MTPWKLFLSSWYFDLPVVIGCALLSIAYLVAKRGKVDGKCITFLLGILTLFLALVSPVDAIGEDYLFSVHMIQHMMLGMIAPVLIVAGIPESFVRAWLKIPFIAILERILGNPLVALFIANATFWVWHLPALYNLTLENDTVHIFEHLLFIITGTMLWWPVFKPIPEGRLAPMPAIIYLGIAASLCTTLGIIFTVSETPYYACYANPSDDLGALKMIRVDWGMTQLDDQKLGGAIMWEPAGAIFLWAIMVAMVEWFKEDEARQSKPQLAMGEKNV
jgi:cytochrome c oxidase assembly factor CtaG